MNGAGVRITEMSTGELSKGAEHIGFVMREIELREAFKVSVEHLSLQRGAYSSSI